MRFALVGDHPDGVAMASALASSGRHQIVACAGVAGHKPSLPGWDVLRRLGGEVLEVSALAEGEVLEAGEPVLLAGRFEPGGLFQVALLPARPAPHWRLAVIGRTGRADLELPQG